MALKQQIDSLADQVLDGRVAFFVGAGFSIESEQNSTSRWQARLLARFVALSENLGERGPRLRARFIDTFALKKPKDWKEADPTRSSGFEWLLEESILNTLGDEYYALNDWMCAAYGELLVELTAKQAEHEARQKAKEAAGEEKEHADPVDEINTLENALLTKCRGKIGVPIVPIDPIELDQLSVISDQYDRGKALFLETIGFLSSEIMAGDPFNEDIYQVLSSYRRRLGRRHDVLARLAREGLCPNLVTANYDLLIEGAYRLAGFEPREPSDWSDPLVPTSFPHFALVADPLEFFQYGDGSRSALVLKLHGCVRHYRECRQATLHPSSGKDRTNPSPWERSLRSIVYTYREIQNWREDSWSRDFLRTLMRTRTLVLCGYSAADNVVHDTFRTVYEELTRHRQSRRARPQRSQMKSEAKAAQVDAPAFFFGPRNQWEFHAVEVLRAASQAVGQQDPELAKHPNYLQFRTDAFPRLDDEFVWLFHRVSRKQQQRALREDLRSVATQLLNSAPLDSELDTLSEHFERVLKEEEEVEAQIQADVEGSAPVQHRFRAVVQWTDQFHPAFLSQLALADAFSRRQGLLGLERMRQNPNFYFPIAERPDWAAWGVVIELALRRMLADRLEDDDCWCNLPVGVVATASDLVPTLLWHRKQSLEPSGEPFSAALAIRWEGDQKNSLHQFPGVPRSRRYWRPSLTQHPWLPETTVDETKTAQLRLTDRAYDTLPCAGELWRWALGAPRERTNWLEEPKRDEQQDEHQHEQQ